MSDRVEMSSCVMVMMFDDDDDNDDDDDDDDADADDVEGYDDYDPYTQLIIDVDVVVERGEACDRVGREENEPDD
jgi:hypothetical protein